MTMRARANPMRSSSLGCLVALRREGPNSRVRKFHHDISASLPHAGSALGRNSPAVRPCSRNMVAEQLTIRLRRARPLSISHVAAFAPAAACLLHPALPAVTRRPSTDWLGLDHEIKHDGFRLMVRRDVAGVRLVTRNGHDWSSRYPLIAQAAGALQVSLIADRRRGRCL
jgi:hypothetical protein